VDATTKLVCGKAQHKDTVKGGPPDTPPCSVIPYSRKAKIDYINRTAEKSNHIRQATRVGSLDIRVSWRLSYGTGLQSARCEGAKPICHVVARQKLTPQESNRPLPITADVQGKTKHEPSKPYPSKLADLAFLTSVVRSVKKHASTYRNHVLLRNHGANSSSVCLRPQIDHKWAVFRQRLISATMQRLSTVRPTTLQEFETSSIHLRGNTLEAMHTFVCGVVVFRQRTPLTVRLSPMPFMRSGMFKAIDEEGPAAEA
jgi:hypothetical protein